MPASFKDIDPNELQVYGSLEKDHLYKMINNVLGPQGNFSAHQSSEFNRLDKWFSELNKYISNLQQANDFQHA